MAMVRLAIGFVVSCSAWMCVSVAYADDSAQKALPWNASTTASPAEVEHFDAKNSALRMIGGLFLCFGLLGAGVHLYRRYVIPRAMSDKRRLQIVERLPLSAKSSLLLVKLDGKEFMLSTGPEAARLISPPRHSEDLFDETLNNACEEVGELNAQ